MKSFEVFISAGETSADILGARAVGDTLAAAQSEGIRIEWHGLAGPKMREAGVAPSFEMPVPSAAGLLELLPRAGELLEFRRRLNAAAFERQYDLAVLIDMPDLHLPLGRRLEAAGVPVLLYVPPQTWAWRGGRARKLAECCRRVAVLFEFEKRHLARYGVDAVYVGHPLFDKWLVAEDTRHEERNAFGVALMPGSRKHEILHNLPPMLGAARLLSAHRNPRFEFEIVHTDESVEVVNKLLDPSLRVTLAARSEIQPCNYDLALCGAGTVSLELAAAGTPFILCHRVNVLSYTIARRLLKTALAAMPNILAGYAAASELLQDECRAERIADEVLHMCRDGGLERQRRAWCRLGTALRAQTRETAIETLILDMLDRSPGHRSSSRRK